ncbi:hypothetical protein B0H19DRAFT_1073750 [Mycena capillaripes]|nr:hypothetical protein B0H19DRAFT_1073750 [Mycena capillaripes]
MQSSTSAVRNPRIKSPFEQRRRTLVACTNCRRRKIKCVNSEPFPRTPCARCVKKDISCDYALGEVQSPISAENSPDLLLTTFLELHHPSMLAPARGSRLVNSSPRSLGEAPPLPYTGPLPPFHRPRYSGSSHYPDLSLYSSIQPNMTQGHYLTQASQPTTNQGYDLATSRRFPQGSLAASSRIYIVQPFAIERFTQGQGENDVVTLYRRFTDVRLTQQLLQLTFDCRGKIDAFPLYN